MGPALLPFVCGRLLPGTEPPELLEPPPCELEALWLLDELELLLLPDELELLELDALPNTAKGDRLLKVPRTYPPPAVSVMSSTWLPLQWRTSTSCPSRPWPSGSARSRQPLYPPSMEMSYAAAGAPLWRIASQAAQAPLSCRWSFITVSTAFGAQYAVTSTPVASSRRVRTL